MNIQNQTPDFDAIKTKQNAAWSSGNYAAVGVTLQLVGETLAETVNLVPGSKVLDVAAGNGNATLAFARRWHKVTSTDYVQTLLNKGAARAVAEGLPVRFQHADAEALPFDAGDFDAVVSTFGVMFAPNQAQAAAEMMRVVRPGGKIALSNWTPDSFIGQLFKTLGGFVTPPAGVQPPSLWGSEDWLRQTFADAQNIEIIPRMFNFRYRNAAHFVEVFREYYGPTHKAFEALPKDRQDDLATAITALLHEFNTETDGSLSVPGAYVDVVITR